MATLSISLYYMSTGYSLFRREPLEGGVRVEGLQWGIYGWELRRKGFCGGINSSRIDLEELLLDPEGVLVGH